MKVTGVFRLGDNERVLAVSFKERPTDEELREFHRRISEQYALNELLAKRATPKPEKPE